MRYRPSGLNSKKTVFKLVVTIKPSQSHKPVFAPSVALSALV
jgi:hypothetical protein